MSYFTENQKKKILFRWLILFFLANLFLYWIIGAAYFSQLSWYGFDYFVGYQKVPILIFVISSYVSHLALLSLWPLLILIPLLWICYLPRLMISISLIIAITLTSLLILDVFIYASYRFHLNGMIVRFIWNSYNQNMLGITRGEIISMVIFVCLLSCLECFFARWLWRFLNKKTFTLKGLGWYGLVLAMFFYISYSAVFNVSYSVRSNAKNVVTLRLLLEIARFLPGYIDLLSIFVTGENAMLVESTKARKIPVQSAQMNMSLKYPLSKLEFAPHEKPMNLVVIVLDAWRFDIFNEQVTPNIYRLSKKAWVFSEHFSGGNATGPGMFSLLYGIPATYWTAMQSQHKSPVLLDELQNNYDVKIISSADLFSPPLSETVFQGIKDLQKKQQAGDNPTIRDKHVTQQFKNWVGDSMRMKKPFFTFLFYDSTHSYCETENIGSPGMICNRLLPKNKEILFTRYKNAAYFIDQQVQEVVSTLEMRGLQKNTVIIITADHGEEFDDNYVGYWGHASNYTPYQIKIPLVVYWPGKQPQQFSHRTSHFDIVPTLMTRLLGCKTKLSDYTVGTDLLDKKPRLPLIIGSYIDFGILESTRVTRVYTTGSYQIEKYNGKITHSDDINIAAMHHAFRDFTHFNQ